MMTLAAAASYFDRTPILDPDNGTVLFMGQVDPYDDSRRDAGAAYRRILSVKPGTALPANRSVRVHNQVWLLGALEVDGLAAPHRDKYVMQPAPGKINVHRLTGFLEGAAPAATPWAAVEWLKDVKEADISSRVPSMYNVFMPAGVDARPRDVLANSEQALLVLEVHDKPSGYRVATALRLDDALPLQASIISRTYSPAAGAFTEAAPVAAPALRVRWQNLFQYGSQADERYQEGDCTIALPTGTAITTRDRVSLYGLTWAILAVDDFGGAVVTHARRA